MIASTTPGTHSPRICAQTVTNRLLEIVEIPPYTVYVLYAAFLFWPSILKPISTCKCIQVCFIILQTCVVQIIVDVINRLYTGNP